MALRTNTAFRRLFAGRVITNAGDSLYLIATMWLVYDLTGSTTYTGLAGFLLMLPASIQFLVGPLVDRWPSRSLLVVTQVVQGVLVLVIPLAWLTGHLSVWVLLVLVPLLSLLNQFVYPTLNAVVPRVVERDDLMRANTAFSAAYQGIDMVFNALGGVVIALVGAVALFVLDAVTFAVAALCFATVHIPRAKATPGATAMDGGADEAPASYLADLREGFDYIWGTVLWKMSLVVFVGVFTFWSTFVSLPAFADARGGPALYGLLLAGIAAGIFVGFLITPKIQNRHFGRVMRVLHPVCCLGWIGVLVVSWVPGIVVMAALSTVVIGVHSVSVQTIVQTVVPEHLLGRVSSLNTSIAGSAAPLGALCGGLFADAAGAWFGTAPFLFGVAAVGAAFFVDPDLRRLPAVTAMAASDLGLPAAE